MHVRHGLATALVMLLGLALVAPASATVSGTYDSGTGVLTVAMSAAGDTARVHVDGDIVAVNGPAWWTRGWSTPFNSTTTPVAARRRW